MIGGLKHTTTTPGLAIGNGFTIALNLKRWKNNKGKAPEPWATPGLFLAQGAPRLNMIDPLCQKKSGLSKKTLAGYFVTWYLVAKRLCTTTKTRGDYGSK